MKEAQGLRVVLPKGAFPLPENFPPVRRGKGRGERVGKRVKEKRVGRDGRRGQDAAKSPSQICRAAAAWASRP